MTASGSKSLPFDKTERLGSAWTFLDTILGRLKHDENEEILNDNVLQIQIELQVVRYFIEQFQKSRQVKNCAPPLCNY